MSDITTDFYELIADVNPVEIGSHIESRTLSEWCNSWCVVMKTAVESVDKHVAELERELAAAKEDIPRNCGTCLHNYVTPLDYANCKIGESNCKWEWRFTMEGEGK